jgi:agmatine deiminase
MRGWRPALRNLKSTPTRDGFRMPAEYERHSACWMLLPERTDNWRLGAKPAQAAFVGVASAIARGEPVTVGVSAAQFQNARMGLPPQIRVVEISSNDAWIRDCGPTFVIDAKGRRRGVDWTFNAWGGLDGGLYFPWDRDDEIAQKVLEIEGADRYRTSFVLEGGAIHVDGQGTCLTTEECLLNPNRNRNASRADVESVLKRYLGVTTVIWLGKGVFLDETGGHIDELACFTGPGQVALTWTEDRTDPQYEISFDAYQRLRNARDARCRQFTIHKIHQPGPLFMTADEAAGIDVRAGSHPRRAGDRLPASYINFYIANKCVVMPLYDKRWDAAAARTLERLFPSRKVIGVATREVLLGGGNIHCITQQVPQPATRRRRVKAPETIDR